MKWLKLWIAVLAILWMIWGSLYMYNTAEAASNNTITLTIGAFNGWNNTCTWANYSFSATASPTEQTKTDSHIINCAFWKTGSSTVTLQMSWNMSWPQPIQASNIKVKNTQARTATPSDLGSSALTSYAALSSAQTLFTKAANKVWTWAGSAVEIQITIPAWAPNGTYNWTLVLTY